LKLFSLFSRPTLKASWAFTPRGTIWRLFPATSGELIIEARDQDTKRAAFFALDGDTGIPRWQDLVLDEPWWIGIEDVSGGVLLLHKFGSPDLPQHQGIIAIELRTGKILWSNNELTYWFAQGNSIFAHRMMFDKRVASELNLQNGQSIREFGEDFESSLFQRREEAVKENQDGLQFPEMAELERVDPRISEMMKREFPATQMHGNVEYALVDKVLLMNYYVSSWESGDEGPSLNNHFKILDVDNNRVMFSDTIAHNVRVAVPDSFFVRNGMVYYIKDQKTLTAIRLSQR
jgi:hypothetical protein